LLLPFELGSPLDLPEVGIVGLYADRHFIHHAIAWVDREVVIVGGLAIKRGTLLLRLLVLVLFLNVFTLDTHFVRSFNLVRTQKVQLRICLSWYAFSDVKI